MVALVLYILKFWPASGTTSETTESSDSQDWDSIRNWSKVRVAR